MDLLKKLAPLALSGFLFFSPLSANSETPQSQKEQTYPYLGLSVSPRLEFSEEFGSLPVLNKEFQGKARISAGINRNNFRIEAGYSIGTKIAPFEIDSMGLDAICYSVSSIDGIKYHFGIGLSLVNDLKDFSIQQSSIGPITTAGIDFPIRGKTNFYSDLSYRFIGMPLKLESGKIIDQISFSLDFGLRLGF